MSRFGSRSGCPLMASASQSPTQDTLEKIRSALQQHAMLPSLGNQFVPLSEHRTNIASNTGEPRLECVDIRTLGLLGILEHWGGLPNMTPVAGAKRRLKFDPKTFLSTMDGGRTIAAVPKRQHLCSGRLVRCCVLYTERKGKTHRCVAEREGSHNRHFERGRFLRRRLPHRAAPPHVLRNRDDRLHGDANR